MATAAVLASLLQHKSDLAHYTQQQIFFANKQSATAAKVADMKKHDEAWVKDYDKVMDADKDVEVKSGKAKGTYTAGDEHDAERYANKRQGDRDEEAYLNMCDLDMEYDSMKAMYEALQEELRAMVDAEKEKVSTDAQDTNILGE